MIQKTEFSLQLDESTLPDNQALLMAYVRFMNSGVTHKEMLFAKTLKTDTKGRLFLILLHCIWKRELSLWKIILIL